MNNAVTGEQVDLDEPIVPTLSSDLAYRVLSDTRRRYAFHYLKQCRVPVSVRELAEQVAAWENAKPTEDLTSQERKRVYISLYQSHLPTLHKEGIVEYDANRGMVQLPEEIADMKVYLEVVPKGNVPWSLYYVGLTALNALLLALAYFEVAPFDSVPDLGWGIIVLVTFGASALVQTYYTHQMQFGDPGPPPGLRSGD